MPQPQPQRALPPRDVAGVVLSHAHPENVLGLGALTGVPPRYPFPVLATPATDQLMRERCERCRTHAAAQDDALAPRQRPIVYASQRRAKFQRLDVGSGALWWLPFAGGHVPGNAALFVPQGRVLLAGGLVVNGEIPDLADADIGHWLAALTTLGRLQPRQVVPDHGDAGGPELIAQTAAYLHELRAHVAAALADGVDLADVAARVPMPHFEHWRGYAALHAVNVRREYARQERALLRAAP